jgi:hypothetical protein
MNKGMVLGAVIIQFGGASAPAYIPLQIYRFRKWRGG